MKISYFITSSIIQISFEDNILMFSNEDLKFVWALKCALSQDIELFKTLKNNEELPIVNGSNFQVFSYENNYEIELDQSPSYEQSILIAYEYFVQNKECERVYVLNVYNNEILFDVKK